MEGSCSQIIWWLAGDNFQQEHTKNIGVLHVGKCRVEIFNLQDEFGFEPLTIAEGVLRAPTGTGDHFRVSEETAAAIREVMKGAAPGKGSVK